MIQNSSKSLDPVVLPVETLEVARAHLSALGFTVAPDGHHPFGTSNVCVFFQNDTYFEPLAVTDEQIYKKEADHGNGFLRRDKLYRNNVGENGFSLIALTCSDAATERDQYRSLGYDCGPVISFRRDVKQPDGSEKQIAVNLFITSSEKSPDLALFSCQWVSEKMFDDAHKVHANGAIGISSIAIASDGADETSRYLTNIAGEFNTDSHEIGLQNCNLVQLTAEELKQDYDIEHNDAQPGSRAVAMDIIVSDIYYTAVVLRISGIASKQIGNRLVVAPAAGQGYTIAFIEQENTQ